MEALPASRAYLTFIGVDTGLSVSKYGMCWKYLIRFLIILLNLGLIGFHLYNILFRDRLHIMAFANIAIFSLLLLTYISLSRKSRKVLTLLKQSLEFLKKDEISGIKRYDRRHFLIKLGYGVFFMAVGSIYMMFNGIRLESLGIAVALTKGSDVSPAFFVTFMAIFAFFCSHFSLMIQYYISVLHVMEVIAGHVHKKLTRSRGSVAPDYELTLRSLEWYNDLMQAVNEDLGFLPFAVFATKFVVFTSGITFLVTSCDDQDTSPAFAVMTVCAPNALYMIFAFQIIHKSVKSWKLMSKSWRMAGESIKDPAVSGTATKKSLAAKKALKFYLTTERVAEVRASGNIIIDRSLLLSFLSQMIPFTVMMFTTVKEFDRKSHKTP